MHQLRNRMLSSCVGLMALLALSLPTLSNAETLGGVSNDDPLLITAVEAASSDVSSQKRTGAKFQRNAFGHLVRADFGNGTSLVFGRRNSGGVFKYESVTLVTGHLRTSDWTAAKANIRLRAADSQKYLSDEWDDEWEQEQQEEDWYAEIFDFWDLNCGFGSGGSCPSPRRACIDQCHDDADRAEVLCRSMSPTDIAGRAACWTGIYFVLQMCISGCPSD